MDVPGDCDSLRPTSSHVYLVILQKHFKSFYDITMISYRKEAKHTPIERQLTGVCTVSYTLHLIFVY